MALTGRASGRSLRPIGLAARFFLTRHWEQTWVGPYVITTAEVRPSAYETTVTWGEGGPQVESLGSALCLDLADARAAHEAACVRVERELGARGQPAPQPPAA